MTTARRILGHLFALGLSATCVLVAETPEEEIGRLREHLHIAESIPVSLANLPALPAGSPLRTYIATGLDTGVRQNLVGWIGDWNKKKGKKYGIIQIVDTLDDAEVILARYMVRERATTEIAGTAYRGNGSFGPITIAPVFAYVIARQPDRLVILRRYADGTVLAEGEQTGRKLWDLFSELMTERHKSTEHR